MPRYPVSVLDKRFLLLARTDTGSFYRFFLGKAPCLSLRRLRSSAWTDGSLDVPCQLAVGGQVIATHNYVLRGSPSGDGTGEVDFCPTHHRPRRTALKFGCMNRWRGRRRARSWWGTRLLRSPSRFRDLPQPFE